MHTAKLPDHTLSLLEALRHAEGIGEFVLVGGTALTLRHQHRLSEDLDFAYTGSRLPRAEISRIIAQLRDTGWSAAPIPDPRALDEFADDGLDLNDYQQDFLVGENPADGGSQTKLTFFRPSDPVLLDGSGREQHGDVAVAGDAEIFGLKSLILAERIRSRDVFDLWWLLENAGFTVADMERAYRLAQQADNLQTAFARIARGRYAKSDPGYIGTLPGMPDRDQAQQLLWNKISDWLEARAIEAFRAS
ncbi:MAG: hypothetical protein JWQ90_4400 [Hydrocarboniphaga sp.]|uniref:nucleotidyl transferase AbiEii/AbiGii toxin family protein n=1 Tax=Hydrocarboniphaga sp. TaxID=2033016 RepID=UPI0026286EA0|nr:nucleotidyl transferase AbiEii/AbiGii toxin family protein [Hydrocarboniphaga sp.]MDB5971950.1 hypothetical protein [Hydrocarboniphaga sp.]